MGWLGQEVLIEELLFKTQHGIVDQSLHARMGAEPTNGDGFGMGWYGAGEGPGVYHSVAPAWGDSNLRELAAHIESPLFLAHVRAAIGSPIQATNCHPFRRGRWLFVHNGFIADFHTLRRDLMLAIDPARFADVQGSTDTEVVFHLALTLGLESDPIGALERTVGLIEATAHEHGVAAPVQATFGVSDGTCLWAVRYATEGPARSLFASADVDTVKRLHPDAGGLARDSGGDSGLRAPRRRAGAPSLRAGSRSACHLSYITRSGCDGLAHTDRASGCSDSMIERLRRPSFALHGERMSSGSRTGQSSPRL
jgi:glutamine amidotransferase